jgi:imidazolonepropionase-like amidohydrolase
VTAEVRVGDVLDATEISLYRQLAGGVTSSNLLHGSANAIGGQNQVIKLRWGLDAEGLKFEGAKPGIKFALGENVKRANFPALEGDPRYPATRMGVEQVLRDAFLAAQRYREQRKADPQTRRDLQMEALVELLEKKRVVHIHSYRADEILMFVALAKEFGLEVATFQHVLEAYKVAPEIASLNAGASGFSDWWGYKVEVQDAIPYSGAMTQKAGVLTSFNSDSDELARRLNTEAAKALRYGGKAWGMTEAEALKFVTLNPAKQLRIDGRVGSLEVGKDADFVIWSAHPLSSAAKAEQTWIDGRRYFSRDEDAQLRERDRAERARLVALALPERAKATAPPEGRPATPLTAALDQLQLQRWLHEMNRDRHSYFGGDAWHECTQDAY